MKETKATTENKPIGIFQAISAAVGEVKIIKKDDKNKFDGYNFASIDKFLELVNPICAKHGLFPSITETGYEYFKNKKDNAWVRVFYEITMYHSSGETFGPSKRAVAVPMNGAQAYGSAQSYALKQYFRSLFMIPTGDKDDADLNATDSEIETKLSWSATIIAELPDDATEIEKATAIGEAIKAQFKRKKTFGELKNEWDRRAKLIASLEPKFKEMRDSIVDAYESRMHVIEDEKLQ